MDTFWVWHLIMFNMVQGWRTSLPPVYHTESPATWILGQLRLSILLINREKQNKTNKQKKARKREKKVKTSFRESVLQFRKIMVGPPAGINFLRNRLRIMLPFRYVTLRVRFSTSTFTTALAFSEVSLTACCGPWACPQLRLGTSAS